MERTREAHEPTRVVAFMCDVCGFPFKREMTRIEILRFAEYDWQNVECERCLSREVTIKAMAAAVAQGDALHNRQCR